MHWLPGRRGLALAFRQLVPEGRPLVYLERAGRHISVLPVYPKPSPRRLVLTLSAEDTAEVQSLTGEFYYYRSSVCTTAEGRAACARVESTLVLTPLAERAFAARSSINGLDYDEQTVRVALFRATRAAEAARSGPQAP